MTRIAINGFGRIGRLVFRALYTQGLFGKDIEVVAVGDIVPADNLAYLLKYDSIQGKFEGKVDSKKSSPAFTAVLAAASGFYFYAIDAPGLHERRKMILLK